MGIVCGRLPLLVMANPLSLSELNQTVKQALADNLAPSYWVIAEIGQMQVTQKGHCYLELVEKNEEGITAKLRATIWAYTYRIISGWFESLTGQHLEPGLKVLVHAVVQFHEVYGLSLNVKDIDPNYTLGERARHRQEVLARLQADGILEMNRELTLPIAPQRVAILSSPTAAGYEDFMEQLGSNSYGYQFHTRLFPATMQGDDAVPSLLKALLAVFEEMENFDVIVLLRGGGSQLDLDCFDNYDLASHLAQFPLPVITGIGHERDETIADLVAHTKMKTPTAVAEFLIQGLLAYEEDITVIGEQLQRYARTVVDGQGQVLMKFSTQLNRHAQELVHQQERMLEGHQLKLEGLVNSQLAKQKGQLKHFQGTLLRRAPQAIHQAQERLFHLNQLVQLLDPKALLARGYSLTLLHGKALSAENTAKPGDIIQTMTANQVLESEVVKVKSTEDGKENANL